MKGARSSLNPNAQAYVPVSRRGLTIDNKVNGFTKTGQPKLHEKSFDNLKTAEDSKPKDRIVNRCNGFSSSRSQNEVIEKKLSDDKYETDLAFLSLMFPDFAGESHADVYKANDFDLESSIDMLNDLENFKNECDSFEASASGN